jgi:hypothetical protein
MKQRGQTTPLAERVEIGERWQAGQNDPQIAQGLQRPLSTIRKWRRRYQHQGRAGLSSPMGRPRSGALGHCSTELVQAITSLRQDHPGWGPITILTELAQDPHWAGHSLPSRSRIAAYFKAQGWAHPYQHRQELPEPTLSRVDHAHQEWEMDAQGVILVDGLGRVSLINGIDVFSGVKVISLACQHKSHANTPDHQLGLRCGFVSFGLPEGITLDHDSVFYDSKTGSPFPTLLHLWLIALGIQVSFLHRPPPAEHARIERMHQTVTRQALAGQHFPSLLECQTWLDERRHFLNWDYPCRAWQGQAPLKACPQAQASPRPYRLEWEADLLDMQRVYAYLAQGRWFRVTSNVGMFTLGDQRYNAHTLYANQTLEITFDAHTCELICLPEMGLQPFRLPIQGLTKQTLMGEWDPPEGRLPAYQLALPFSQQTWRQWLLMSQLPGTIL